MHKENSFFVDIGNWKHGYAIYYIFFDWEINNQFYLVFRWIKFLFRLMEEKIIIVLFLKSNCKISPGIHKRLQIY